MSLTTGFSSSRWEDRGRQIDAFDFQTSQLCIMRLCVKLDKAFLQFLAVF